MFERTMTDTELEIVLSKASALSAFFREIGPKYDQENTFAYPSIRAFKDSGLGAVPVPKHFGGRAKAPEERADLLCAVAARLAARTDELAVLQTSEPGMAAEPHE